MSQSSIPNITEEQNVTFLIGFVSNGFCFMSLIGAELKLAVV